MKSFLSKLWQDESGQGATEYILILVVVAVIVMVFKDKIVTIIETRTEEMGGKLGEVFKGR
ncbi:MAG: Flp1 family type IVb pilin [Bdellovibrionales bacterium]|nr:Flp1 family type IVb pilin [Bdellovibrionales bacterium]